MTLQELWTEEAGLMILLIGVGLVILGCLIYSDRRWVRHLLMAGIVVVGLSGFIRPEYADVPAGVLITVAVIAIGIGIRYFYFRPEVIAFFALNQEEVDPKK